MSEFELPTETPVTVEAEEPVENLVQKLNSYFYARGQVTREARFAHSEENSVGSEYPLFARSRRAKLYHEIRQLRAEHAPIEAQKEVVERAHTLDKILKQYLSQNSLHIPLGELGLNSSKRIILHKDDSAAQRPPIFLIPGIANDVECVGNLAVELALSGREVTVVGYPDSFSGTVSAEFAQAVECDRAFGPHSQYFSSALSHCYPEGDVEVWGYSTGAPIAVEMLCKQDKIRERVSGVTLVSPAAVTEQSVASVKVGVVKDIQFVREKAGLLPNMSWTTGLKEGDESKEHAANRHQSFNGLLKHIVGRSPYWEKMKLREGARTCVVSGERDAVVKSHKSADFFRELPQCDFVSLPNGYHATACVDPVQVIAAAKK